MKKVIIKPKNLKKYNKHPGWVTAMDKYIGQTVTISCFLGKNLYEAKEIPYAWHKDWLKDPLEVFLEELDNENDNS